jgi:hypothetical protein
LRKSCGIDGIPNECIKYLPRRPLVHLTHLSNHCLRLSHFLKSWKSAKIITLPKPGKDPKFPQNLSPINLLSTTGKIFEKVILKILQKHIDERGLLNASQFGFRARHSTTLQCNKQRKTMVSKKYGGRRGAPQTKPPELQRKRQFRP